jgi:hypothetical protein
MNGNDYPAYLAALKAGNFVKLARLRFLNPGGDTAFILDNDPMQKHSGAFIKSGSVTVNLQNGARRSANVEIANADGEFDFKVNHVWFGTEIAVDMGLMLQDGTECWFPQGVFRVERPSETVATNGTIAHFNLIDKWAGIDGTLNGALESSYGVASGTNIFNAISALLLLERGDGRSYDSVTPIFTDYYNNKTQMLPGGSYALLVNTSYNVMIDGTGNSVASVITELCSFLQAWVGYDATGALRVDPSQDDISDADKPVLWRYSMDEAQIVGLSYESMISEVCNDYIVTGYATGNSPPNAARAINMDAASPVCVQRIGRRTVREDKPEFSTWRMCEDYAVWKAKRMAALRRSVSVSANQIFHLQENNLIEIARTDKPGNPVERHLVQGFTLPFSGAEPMTIQAISVEDFPNITSYVESPDIVG